MLAVSPQMVREWQEGLQVHGRTIAYARTASGEVTARNIKARVYFLSAVELAAAVEAYPIRLTLDARDFAAGALPAKGDTATIDGARRGVMQVAPVHVGENIAGYRLGVQG
jgi:hypothetical protein